ncbi:class F sortase [Tersicoccus phoenicis]|uniref:class F sortase n=1 Tax=Tersicoccus phoenicis TaxID=554083 RepID=UPI0009FF2375|nr:class F sortase [Tersicoccus phoenicis]
MTSPTDPAGARPPKHRQGRPFHPGRPRTGAPARSRVSPAAGPPLRLTRGSAALGVAGLALLASTSVAALPPAEPGDPSGLVVTAPSASPSTSESPTSSGSGPSSRPASASPPGSDAAPRSPVLGKVPLTRATPRPPRAATIPVELRAPAQDLALPVDPMGVDGRGAMAIPQTPGRASWYRYGPAPGDPGGSAVFAGHVDAPWGKTPLYRIKDLKPGDAVDVVLSTGAVLPYRVRAVDAVAKARLGATDLFRRDGSPVLRLVTCGGPWLPDRQDYRDNVVVTAEPAR